MKSLYSLFAVIFCLSLLSAGAFAQNNSADNYTKKTILGWIGLSAVQSTTGDVQESYIIINPEATYGFDQQFDAEFNPGAGPTFYSLAGEQKLSTNSIPYLSNETEVNFVFSVKETGVFKIFASGLELIENQVYIYDQITRADVNLTLNPEYTFNAAIGDDSARFILHFKPTTGMDPYAEATSLKAYYLNNTLYFNSFRDKDQLRVYDLGGKQLLKLELGEGRQHSVLTHLPRGMFVARLQSGNASYNAKFMVR